MHDCHLLGRQAAFGTRAITDGLLRSKPIQKSKTQGLSADSLRFVCNRYATNQSTDGKKTPVNTRQRIKRTREFIRTRGVAK